MSALIQTIALAGAALAAVLGIILLAGRGARMLRLAQPTAGLCWGRSWHWIAPGGCSWSHATDANSFC